jgi:hypothetical protein
MKGAKRPTREKNLKNETAVSADLILIFRKE